MFDHLELLATSRTPANRVLLEDIIEYLTIIRVPNHVSTEFTPWPASVGKLTDRPRKETNQLNPPIERQYPPRILGPLPERVDRSLATHVAAD